MLTLVQARRVLAYLTVLERAVIEGDVAPDGLPIWEQLEEVIIGLDGLSLTIDAVVEALGDDEGGGDEGGVREPRQPPPGGGLVDEKLHPEDAGDAPPSILGRSEVGPGPAERVDVSAQVGRGRAASLHEARLLLDPALFVDPAVVIEVCDRLDDLRERSGPPTSDH
jgi:hypothetical protein